MQLNQAIKLLCYLEVIIILAVTFFCDFGSKHVLRASTTFCDLYVGNGTGST